MQFDQHPWLDDHYHAASQYEADLAFQARQAAEMLGYDQVDAALFQGGQYGGNLASPYNDTVSGIAAQADVMRDYYGNRTTRDDYGYPKDGDGIDSAEEAHNHTPDEEPQNEIITGTEAEEAFRYLYTTPDEELAPPFPYGDTPDQPFPEYYKLMLEVFKHAEAVFREQHEAAEPELFRDPQAASFSDRLEEALRHSESQGASVRLRLGARYDFLVMAAHMTSEFYGGNEWDYRGRFERAAGVQMKMADEDIPFFVSVLAHVASERFGGARDDYLARTASGPGDTFFDRLAQIAAERHGGHLPEHYHDCLGRFAQLQADESPLLSKVFTPPEKTHVAPQQSHGLDDSHLSFFVGVLAEVASKRFGGTKEEYLDRTARGPRDEYFNRLANIAAERHAGPAEQYFRDLWRFAELHTEKTWES